MPARAESLERRARHRAWPEPRLLSLGGYALAVVLTLACSPPAMREPNTEEGVARAKRALASGLERAQANPGDARAAFELARNYWIIGDLDSAERWLARGLAAVPDDATAVFDLCRVLAERGRYSAAAAHCRKFLDLKSATEAQREWATDLVSAYDSVAAGASVGGKTWQAKDHSAANTVGMEFVEVPAGEFVMGRSDGPRDEAPPHAVVLSPFWIGKYEVTAAQFGRFVAETGYKVEFLPPTGDAQAPEHPAVQVSWRDARAFTMWLSQREDAVYRLPSEAEWEYAARGTDARTEPWGFEKGRPGIHGNWGQNGGALENGGRPTLSRVGSFPQGRSFFGGLDMAGNASEWCLDFYDPHYYRRSPARNPFGPAAIGLGNGALRVLRGSSWKHELAVGHATHRYSAASNQAYTAYGFRVVREE